MSCSFFFILCVIYKLKRFYRLCPSFKHLYPRTVVSCCYFANWGCFFLSYYHTEKFFFFFLMNRLSRPCCVCDSIVFRRGKCSTVTWGALWFTSPFIRFLILPFLNSIWIIPLFPLIFWPADVVTCQQNPCSSSVFTCERDFSAIARLYATIAVLKEPCHTHHTVALRDTQAIYFCIYYRIGETHKRGCFFFFFFSQTNLKLRSLRYSYKVMSGLRNIVSHNTTQLLIFH